MALGAGLIVSALLMNLTYAMGVNTGIEEKARNLGMVYPQEIRVNLEEGNK